MAHYRLYHPSDAGEVVALKLKQADVDEVTACTGKTPEEVLEDSLLVSEITWVIIGDNGNIIGVFGVSPYHLLDVGVPWLLTTDELKNYNLKFLRQSVGVVEQMLERYPVLTNFTSSKHTEAHQWLEWLGFKINRNLNYYFNDPGTAFWQFSLRRNLYV